MTATSHASEAQLLPLPLYVNLNELEPNEQSVSAIENYLRGRIAARHPEAAAFVDAHLDWALRHGKWLIFDSFDEIHCETPASALRSV